MGVVDASSQYHTVILAVALESHPANSSRASAGCTGNGAMPSSTDNVTHIFEDR